MKAVFFSAADIKCECMVGVYHNILSRLGGLITPPHSVYLEIETPKASRREETWGEVSPQHPTRGSGDRRKLPQRGRPKMDFMHILGQKEAIWNTIFSIFERRRGPPNVAGPGKTFPLSSPLDGPEWDVYRVPQEAQLLLGDRATRKHAKDS